jgi:hypothetical protein
MPNNQASFTPNPVPCGAPANCRIGRQAIHILIDFSLGASYALDLSQVQALGKMDSVQTLYVDNSAGTSTLTIQMSLTLQSITIPPLSQAYIPVLQGNPPQMQFTVGGGTPKVNIQLMNFFLPPLVWGVSASGGSFIDTTLAGILIGNQVPTITNPNNPVLVDRSGTIAVGGTAQQIMAVNAARKKIIIENPTTATEVLLVSFNSGATGTISLAAGGSYIADSDSVEQNSVWVNAATATHAFTAWEG